MSTCLNKVKIDDLLVISAATFNTLIDAARGPQAQKQRTGPWDWCSRLARVPL